MKGEMINRCGPPEMVRSNLRARPSALAAERTRTFVSRTMRITAAAAEHAPSPRRSRPPFPVRGCDERGCQTVQILSQRLSSLPAVVFRQGWLRRMRHDRDVFFVVNGSTGEALEDAFCGITQLAGSAGGNGLHRKPIGILPPIGRRPSGRSRF